MKFHVEKMNDTILRGLKTQVNSPVNREDMTSFDRKASVQTKRTIKNFDDIMKIKTDKILKYEEGSIMVDPQKNLRSSLGCNGGLGITCIDYDARNKTLIVCFIDKSIRFFKILGVNSKEKLETRQLKECFHCPFVVTHLKIGFNTMLNDDIAVLIGEF